MREVSDLKPFDDIANSFLVFLAIKLKSPGDNSPAMEPFSLRPTETYPRPCTGITRILWNRIPAATIGDFTG
jgi:hypothetical protein